LDNDAVSDKKLADHKQSRSHGEGRHPAGDDDAPSASGLEASYHAVTGDRKTPVPESEMSSIPVLVAGVM